MINKFDDFNIHIICEEYGIKNYTINNGLVDVDGNVNLSSWKLDRLPLNFGKVNRHFDCSNNNLTRALGGLEGAPQQVGGYFDCGNNNLISLKGGPKEVDLDFICHSNKLTTLQGAPKEVGGS